VQHIFIAKENQSIVQGITIITHTNYNTSSWKTFSPCKPNRIILLLFVNTIMYILYHKTSRT
jgi:hypothetical protein